MNAKIETLCDNEWLSLKKLVDPDNHIHGYVFSHETRCNGKIISILPFRFRSLIEDPDKKIFELLLRQEVTPCWDRLRQVTSSITGGLENNNERQTAVHELWEEAGYKIVEKELIPLGYSYASKSSDTKYALFSVDLTNKEQEGKAKGDGSKLEELAQCAWIADSIVFNVWDPQVSVMYVRLLSVLQGARNMAQQVKKEK